MFKVIQPLKNRQKEGNRGPGSYNEPYIIREYLINDLLSSTLETVNMIFLLILNISTDLTVHEMYVI